MLELLFGYWLGKRAQKKVPPPPELDMTDYDDWRGNGQDTRSLEQLIKEARENHANKNNQ